MLYLFPGISSLAGWVWRGVDGFHGIDEVMNQLLEGKLEVSQTGNQGRKRDWLTGYKRFLFLRTFLSYVTWLSPARDLNYKLQTVQSLERSRLEPHGVFDPLSLVILQTLVTTSRNLILKPRCLVPWSSTSSSWTELRVSTRLNRLCAFLNRLCGAPSGQPQPRYGVLTNVGARQISTKVI